MNKQTQAPKTRKGVYIKFTLLMIASALTGAFISIFLFGREDGLLQLTRRVSDGLILAGPWLLALGLVPCAVAHGLYLAGQKAAARADEDDDAFETANRRLSLSMAFSAVVMPWMMLTICLALPSVDVLANNAIVVAVVPLMLVEIAWSYGLQAVVVRAMQLADSTGAETPATEGITAGAQPDAVNPALDLRDFCGAPKSAQPCDAPTCIGCPHAANTGNQWLCRCLK